MRSNDLIGVPYCEQSAASRWHGRKARVDLALDLRSGYKSRNLQAGPGPFTGQRRSFGMLTQQAPTMLQPSAMTH